MTSKYTFLRPERHAFAKNVLTGAVIILALPILVPLVALAFLNDGLHEEEIASVTLGER